MLNQKLLDILEQFVRLKEDRGNWLTLWEELRDIFYPDASSFLSEETPGSERRTDVYTSLPELARRNLSTAIQAMVRPDGKRWFKAKPKLVALEGDEQARLWLDVVTSITYAALFDPRANATKVLAECDAGLVTFGTGVVHVGWDAGGRHLTFRSEDLKNVVIIVDKNGHVCGCAVFKSYTLRQIIAMFGTEKLTTKMREKLAAQTIDLDQTFPLAHICIPNDDYKRYGFKPGRFPYASLWFSLECKELIDQGGYWSFPYVVPRWETVSGEIYGRSPAMVALNDARALLKMEETFLDAGEVAVRPSLGAYGDMIRGNVDLRSGGLTLFDVQGFDLRGPPIWPIQTGEIPKEALQFMEMKQARVEAAFYRDVLELPRPDNEKMTAAEINVRHDQYIRQAAPVFARIEANYNAPLINRVFAVLAENGAFPEAPESLWDQEIEFEYESPLKMARDRAEALKVIEGLGMIQQLAEGIGTVAPEKAVEMVDNIDADVLARYIGMKTDLPQILFKPLEKMLAEREARAKKIEQAQMAEMAAKLGPAVGAIAQGAAKAKDSGMLGGNEPFPIPASDIDPSRILEMTEGTDYAEVA